MDDGYQEDHEHMAKVSWNRTWSEKMRKKSRGKKGKNRSRKEK